MNQFLRWRPLCHQPHCLNHQLKVMFAAQLKPYLLITSFSLAHKVEIGWRIDILIRSCTVEHFLMGFFSLHLTLHCTALQQLSLQAEKTLSRATFCLRRVSLKSLQLMAQASSLQRRFPAQGRHLATTALFPSPSPPQPNLFHGCLTVRNLTTIFCPTTNQRLLQR